MQHAYILFADEPATELDNGTIEVRMWLAAGDETPISNVVLDIKGKGVLCSQPFGPAPLRASMGRIGIRMIVEALNAGEHEMSCIIYDIDGRELGRDQTLLRVP